MNFFVVYTRAGATALWRLLRCVCSLKTTNTAAFFFRSCILFSINAHNFVYRLIFKNVWLQTRSFLNCGWRGVFCVKVKCNAVKLSLTCTTLLHFRVYILSGPVKLLRTCSYEVAGAELWLWVSYLGSVLTNTLSIYFFKRTLNCEFVVVSSLTGTHQNVGSCLCS